MSAVGDSIQQVNYNFALYEAGNAAHEFSGGKDTKISPKINSNAGKSQCTSLRLRLSHRNAEPQTVKDRKKEFCLNYKVSQDAPESSQNLLRKIPLF
jgi:hypothetical protein